MLMELKDTLNLLDRFVGHFPIYMYLTDTENKVVWFNRFLSRNMPHIHLGQVLDCHNILNPCETPCSKCGVHVEIAEETFSRILYAQNEQTSPDKKNARKFVEVFSFPVLNGEHTQHGCLRIGVDVSKSELLQEKLRAKQRLYKAIVEGSTDAIIFIDHQNLIREWNSGAEGIFGYTAEEIIGKHVETLIPHELIELGELVHLNTEVRKRGYLKKYETQRLSKNNALLHVDITRSEVFNESGQSIGISEIIKDIHERKDLEFELLRTILELSKLNELNEILYSTREAYDILRITLIAITAGQGLRFNRAFILLADQEQNVLKGHLAIGPSNEEEANRIWSELNHEHHYLRDIVRIYKIDLNGADKRVNEIVGQISIPLDSEDHLLLESLKKRRVIRMKNGVPTGITEQLSTQIDHRNLQEILSSDSFVLVPIFTKQEYIGVIIADNCINKREISGEDIEGLRLFASLAGSALENARLYQALEERIQELQAAYKQLEDQQEQLLRAERLAAIGEMSAKVAHEIRNPLVAIGGFARLIERKIEQNGELKNYAGIIREQVENLENILNNLLGTANPRPPEKRRVDVKEILQQVAEMMANAMSQREIVQSLQFSPEMAYVIMGDPKLLYQAILNLVKNAMDALEGCETRGEISLKCAIENDRVLVSIRDNGKGIPAEDQGKIFDKFYTTKSHGTGLGLSVVREIVESHDGEIHLESQPDKGTCFCLSFPVCLDN